MHVAILRVHKGELSYGRHWQTQERLDMTGVTSLFKVDLEGQIVHKARNQVVEMALAEPTWEVAFMVDDDIILPPGALAQAVGVLEAHPEIKILTGVYFDRRFPHCPQLYEESPEPEFRGKYWPIMDYRERADKEGLLQVDACGGGILFIRREVFENVKRPWFLFMDRIGEDLYFCRKAQTKGYKVWCDVNLQAGHLGVVEIHEAVYMHMRPKLHRALPGIMPPGPMVGEMVAE